VARLVLVSIVTFDIGGPSRVSAQVSQAREVNSWPLPVELSAINSRRTGKCGAKSAP
jgi:hypothetical protein